jgi:hypothetical protein
LIVLAKPAGDKPNTKPSNSKAMLFRLVWGLGKLTVKHVVVPIAITALTAVVLQKLADRVAPPEPNGAVASDVDRANLAI